MRRLFWEKYFAFVVIALIKGPREEVVSKQYGHIRMALASAFQKLELCRLSVVKTNNYGPPG